MDAQKRKLTVVLVPFPYQGHMTPMLQLGSILHSKGFSVAVAHTKFNAPNPSNHPDFAFLEMEDGVEGLDDISFYNTLAVIKVMNESCEARFRDHMARLMDGKETVVACVIYDPIMRFTASVVLEVGVPSVVLRTTTAAYVQSHDVLFQLMEEKIVPIPESQLNEPIPDEPPLKFKDLPLPANLEIPGAVIDFLYTFKDTKSASAIIWNSTDAFEPAPLQRLHKKCKVPFFPIGPFHKLAPHHLPTSMMAEHDGCLSWLDKQAHKSVIYVSFGSMAIIDEKELVDMAKGLIKSEQPFLWAIRPSLLSSGSSNAMESLPKELFVTDRACVVGWAPQKKVLEHPAVGGFFTHCGWNSTLEGVCEGVPLLCRPCFSDQMINARYITDVWRVGIGLEGGSGSEGVDRAVRSLMVGEEGKEVRKRVGEMREKVERCMREGGSAYESLERLVEFIIEGSSSRGDCLP